MSETIPVDWRHAIGPYVGAASIASVELAVARERRDYSGAIFPEPNNVYAALRLTPIGQVRVVILGQDPYPTRGDAHGLAFSVPADRRPPKSLVNILRELADDIGEPISDDGCLEPWARQGVLLLNTILTVRDGAPLSHRAIGWQVITTAVLRAVAKKPLVVPILWGTHARRAANRAGLLDRPHVASAHPSPRSAYRGFVGSAPFTRTNKILMAHSLPEVEWSLATRTVL